jgi:hypothetical protein
MIRHRLLYGAIGMVVMFIFILYLIDYFFNNKKPDCIKTNGKIDRNKQFSFTLGLSFIIYVIFVCILYQIFA